MGCSFQPCAPHNIQHITHNTQRTTYNAQRTTYNVQRTTYNAQRTTHNAQRTTHNTQRTTYNVCAQHITHKRCIYMHDSSSRGSTYTTLSCFETVIIECIAITGIHLSNLDNSNLPKVRHGSARFVPRHIWDETCIQKLLKDGKPKNIN